MFFFHFKSAIQFWSSFICSFREAGIGAISQTFGLMFGSGSDARIDLELEMEGLELEQQNMWFTQYAAQSGSQEIQQSIALDYEAQTGLLSENMGLIEQKLEKQKQKTGLRSLLSLGRIPNVISIILSGPSFLVGGAGLASFTLISDFAQDLVTDIIPGRLQAVRALDYFRNFRHALDPSIKRQSATVSTQSIPQIKDISSTRIDSEKSLLGITRAYNEYMRQKHENIESNLDKVEELRVNSESDSKENSFEIFVADVEQAAVKADPVVEINGIRIWIQPLPAEHYNLDHDMTLNDFLALIGILNDPSKQAIYTNPLTGATYILNKFDGTKPLTEVLDLIGYDRTNLEQQFLGNAHRIQIIDTATILQLQDDTKALFHPDVREEIFYRHGIMDYHRSYFSKKILDAFSIVKSRIQDTFRETLHESAYNIIMTKYSEDFGITQDEWLELVDSKAKDENGAFTQEFEKIVDLCLKEQVFLNLIELSGAQDQDVNAIFSTLDAYLDENFGSLIEQLFAPLTFEAFISEVINQVLNNMDNDEFINFNVPTQEYFEDLISVQDSYKDELVSVKLPLINYEFFNDHWNRDKIETLFYTIEHIKYLTNNPRQFERGLFIRPVFSQLQGPSGVNYGMEYNKILLRKFMKFTDFELTQASWVRINEYNQEVLKNRLNFKDFCRLYLNKFQQDPELSNKYHWLAGFEFSEDPFDFDDTDFVLLQLLDDAMIDFLGFNNYLLLQSSILNFGKENNNYFSDCALHDSRLLEYAKEEFGLKTLDESEFDIYPTNGDYWRAIFKSWFSFGFKREMTINGESRSYIKHPPNSIFSEIFSGYNAWSIDSDYFKIINQLSIGALVQEELIPIGFQEDSTYEAITDNKDIEKKILANFLDEKGNIRYNYEEIRDNDYNDLLNLYEIYEKDGKKRDWGCQDLLKGVVAQSYDEIFRTIDEVYGIKLNDKMDLINKREEIIEKIREKYKLKPNQNLAFALKTFTMNNKQYSIFIVSISGQQFMPGTYLYYDQNNKLKIGYNPLSPINSKYPAIWTGEYYALGHSERKIFISLDTLFPCSVIKDGNLILVSERPFCFSCEIMGIDFYEYYKKYDVFITIAEDPNKYFFIFN